MVFEPLLFLNSAGNVHAIRLYKLHGLGNVLHRQPAGKNNSTKCFRDNSEVPVKGNARASGKLVIITVQKERDHLVVNEAVQAFPVLYLERLDHPVLEPFAAFGPFLAVKLDHPDAGQRLDLAHLLLTFIHEDADGNNKGRKLINDLGPLLRLHAARALGKEVESERVSSEFRRCQCVVEVRYAADFYLDHDKAFLSQKRKARNV